jgi:diguanylate cyclase (GGDEF)-like protein
MSPPNLDDPTVVSDLPRQGGRDALTESSPVLLQYDGASSGKRFVLSEASVIIGRKADRAQIWIDDASISREHCRIDFDGQRAFATDLESTNHTFINDVEITGPAELVHSDMLRVGDIKLRYFSHGGADHLLFDKIYRMAVTDRMLDVFRKDYVQEKIDEEFRIARARNTPLSLLMLDLDKFKSVNDTYGHDAGDLVLRAVADAIKPIVRRHETFGRFGGEEFVLLLPHASLEDATRVAERVRETIQGTTIAYLETTIPVTVSVGVATLTPDMATAADLLKMSDTMVYKAKDGGRNRVCAPG